MGCGCRKNKESKAEDLNKYTYLPPKQLRIREAQQKAREQQEAMQSPSVPEPEAE